MRDLMARILDGLPARIVAMDNPQEALDFLEGHEVAVLLSDLRMPQVDGMTVMKFAKQRSHETQVLMVTGYATVDSAVASFKSGVFDYISKPFENSVLRETVERALHYWRLTREYREVRKKIASAPQGTDTLIGESVAARDIDRLIDAAAAHDCSVLVTGETGSGKELVARQIHARSQRAENRFVAINCAAIPENIIESELFGHEKGAFTGADKAKAGLFEEAGDGTLFLDELNNAPLPLQAKLLRVLQDATFYRLGETVERKVDVRIIAATNRNIQELLEQGALREDLYYRLRVIEIDVPPLRERREDIPFLAHHFLERYAERFGKEVEGLSTEALGALMRYCWPGNVRELENAIQRTLVLGQGPEIGAESLPPEVRDEKDPAGRAIEYIQPQTLKELEAFFISKTLRETCGDRSLAAKILGVDKSTLWRKIKRYGLDD